MHTSDAIIEIRDLTFGYDAGNPVLDEARPVRLHRRSERRR